MTANSDSILDFLIKVLIVLAALILYFVLKYYWPKYFETKASNQATKEDIGEITHIVETIKTDLGNRTEELKSVLSRQNDHIINLNSIERNAILSYNKATWSFISFCFNSGLSNYDEENIHEINSIKTRLEILLLEKYSVDAEIALFFDQQNYILLNSEMNQMLLALKNALDITIIKKTKITNVLIIRKRDSNLSPDQIRSIYNDMNQELLVIMSDYYTSQKAIYGQILEQWKKIRIILLTRLKAIAQ